MMVNVPIVELVVTHVHLILSVLNVSLNSILKLINLVLLAQLTVKLVLLKLPTELKLVTVPNVINPVITKF